MSNELPKSPTKENRFISELLITPDSHVTLPLHLHDAGFLPDRYKSVLVWCAEGGRLLARMGIFTGLDWRETPNGFLIRDPLYWAEVPIPGNG